MNGNFCIKYAGTLAINGAIMGRPRKKLYQEIHFESLQQWHYFSKPSFLYIQTLKKGIFALQELNIMVYQYIS